MGGGTRRRKTYHIHVYLLHLLLLVDFKRRLLHWRVNCNTVAIRFFLLLPSLSKIYRPLVKVSSKVVHEPPLNFAWYTTLSGFVLVLLE